MQHIYCITVCKFYSLSLRVTLLVGINMYLSRPVTDCNETFYATLITMCDFTLPLSTLNRCYRPVKHGCYTECFIYSTCMHCMCHVSGSYLCTAMRRHMLCHPSVDGIHPPL